METNENPWAGFDVISTYSLAQAIEDVIWVDLSRLARRGLPLAIGGDAGGVGLSSKK